MTDLVCLLVDIGEAGFFHPVFQKRGSLQVLSMLHTGTLNLFDPVGEGCGLLNGFVIAKDLVGTFLQFQPATWLEIFVRLTEKLWPITNASTQRPSMNIVKPLFLRVGPRTLDVVDIEFAIRGHYRYSTISVACFQVQTRHAEHFGPSRAGRSSILTRKKDVDAVDKRKVLGAAAVAHGKWQRKITLPKFGWIGLRSVPMTIA